MVTPQKLLLICGFPGGGTDLTKSVVNAHPEIYISGEMSLFRIAQSRFRERPFINNHDDLEEFKNIIKKCDGYCHMKPEAYNITMDDCTGDSAPLENILYKMLPGENSLVKGSKTPQFTEHLMELSEIFPNTLFLVVLRDIRDICLSWKKKWGRDMYNCASKWAQRMEKKSFFSYEYLKDRTYFIKYEELISKTKQTCENICSFLEIPFSVNMLEHHNYTTTAFDGKINYGKPIRKKNKEKWRHELTERTVKRIEEIAFNTMIQHEYFPEIATEGKIIYPHEKLIGILQDMYAFLFVGNRYSKTNDINYRLKRAAGVIKKRIDHLFPIQFSAK